jgi:hypothetical protein
VINVSYGSIVRIGAPANDGDLKHGGGDDTLPPMDIEPRVAKLEAHMEHVRSSVDKLTGIPKDVAVLAERISHLPGKGFVVTAGVGTVAGVTGLLVLLQHLGILH